MKLMKYSESSLESRVSLSDNSYAFLGNFLSFPVVENGKIDNMEQYH